MTSTRDGEDRTDGLRSVRVGRRAALIGGVGVVAAVAGCSSARPAVVPSPAPAPTSPSASPTPKATPTARADTRPRWPLTGKLMSNADQARHAAVAVKVPDNQQEHPQRGIDSADIVFVELEGYRDGSGYSSTRLVPVFHSSMPESVSPVRSVRPVDVALLSPMDAIIGNTGGSKWVINYVKANRDHLEGTLSFIATQGSGSYGTDPSRVYFQNGQYYYDRAIICHPKVLAKQTKRFRSGPQQSYFPFATGTDEPSTAGDGSTKITSLQIPYKGDGYLMGYRYDTKTKRYLRSMPWGPHVLADGTRVSVDNVMVIKAHQHYGKIFRGGGEDEPLHDIIDASGGFLYLYRGRAVTGTWRKGAIDKPFSFTLADGTPLKMAPGQTFVELPDTKAKLRIKA